MAWGEIDSSMDLLRLSRLASRSIIDVPVTLVTEGDEKEEEGAALLAVPDGSGSVEPAVIWPNIAMACNQGVDGESAKCH